MLGAFAFQSCKTDLGRAGQPRLKKITSTKRPSAFACRVSARMLCAIFLGISERQSRETRGPRGQQAEPIDCESFPFKGQLYLFSALNTSQLATHRAAHI